MANFGEQMDPPGVYDEKDKRESPVEPETPDAMEEEKITPIIPDNPAQIEFERSCPVCGDSGPCYACDRGIELAEEFKKRQKEVEREKKQRKSRKKAS
jgi:hypothetical protein